MGIIDRLNLLVRSNIGAREKTDPVGGYRSALAEMELTLRDARRRLTRVLDDERRLEQDLDNCRREEERWETRAMQALRQNDETLAREALVERNRASRKTDAVMAELRKHRTYLADLMSGLEALESKIDGVRARGRATSPVRREPEHREAPVAPRRRPIDDDAKRWEQMVSRRSHPTPSPRAPVRAPAAPAVDTALDTLDQTVSKFEEYEKKLSHLEAEVEAQRELTDLQPYHEDDPLFDPKLAELERRFRELELKKKTGKI